MRKHELPEINFVVKWNHSLHSFHTSGKQFVPQMFGYFFCLQPPFWNKISQQSTFCKCCGWWENGGRTVFKGILETKPWDKEIASSFILSRWFCSVSPSLTQLITPGIWRRVKINIKQPNTKNQGKTYAYFLLDAALRTLWLRPFQNVYKIKMLQCRFSFRHVAIFNPDSPRWRTPELTQSYPSF